MQGQFMCNWGSIIAGLQFAPVFHGIKRSDVIFCYDPLWSVIKVLGIRMICIVIVKVSVRSYYAQCPSLLSQKCWQLSPFRDHIPAVSETIGKQIYYHISIYICMCVCVCIGIHDWQYPKSWYVPRVSKSSYNLWNIAIKSLMFICCQSE